MTLQLRRWRDRTHGVWLRHWKTRGAGVILPPSIATRPVPARLNTPAVLSADPAEIPVFGSGGNLLPARDPRGLCPGFYAGGRRPCGKADVEQVVQERIGAGIRIGYSSGSRARHIRNLLLSNDL